MHDATAPEGALTDERALARAVVGIAGDKRTPAWKDATTARTRRRVTALAAVAAGEAAGTVALVLMLPALAVLPDRDWSAVGLAAVAVIASVVYGLAGLLGIERFPAQRRVRAIQLLAISGGVLTIACGLLPNLVVAAVLVIARAAVFGLQVSSFRPLIYDAVVPEARVRAFSRVAAGALLGGAVGALVAAAVVSGESFGQGMALVGLISVVLALMSLRLTDPGEGGVEPARIHRAFGVAPKAELLRTSFPASVGRVMLVHTVRTSLSSYVAVGALGYGLLHPWVVAMQSSSAKSDSSGLADDPLTNSSIFANLGIVLAVVALVVIAAGNGLERDRRFDVASLVRSGWILPGAIGGIGALLMVIYDADSFGAVPFTVFLGLMIAGGVLAKVALDVSTMSVVSAADRPIVAAVTTFSWASGAFLAFLIVPLASAQPVRTGFVALVLLLVLSLFVGKRLMQQPDADFDALLPIGADEILAETPHTEPSGLAAEVSPYAYAAPPAEILDPTGQPPLLSTEKLNFAYGSIPVLFDVDITVNRGELVAVLGPNGVGKTTLLRCLSGLEIPQQGVVRFNGEDITKTAAARRVGLGLSQIVGGNAVFGTLSVAENLQMYGYSATSDKKAVAEGIARAYEVFPRLADRRNQLGSTLSGGEQQMLGLSKALILKPDLLVVDEFSLGLAPVVVGELLAMVRALNAEGTAVLLVEQSVNVALNLVDRCYFMEKGRVIHHDTAEALRARPDLVQALSLGGLPQELEESHA